MSEIKNYLVAGGTSGIGLELVTQLKKQGHHVAVVARRTSEIEGVQSIQLDVTKDTIDITPLPDVLHGFIYCPGSINLKPFHRLLQQDFLDDFQINVLGAISLLQAVLPRLKNSPQASVLFFSTVAVQQGMPFHASVAASKGAIEGLTKALAAEWAPKIRVNAIAPSLTNTPLASKLLSSDEKIKNGSERHPLKKIGTPNDIASMAAFLLSPEASWITGQIFAIDGGLSTLRVS